MSPAETWDLQMEAHWSQYSHHKSDTATLWPPPLYSQFLLNRLFYCKYQIQQGTKNGTKPSCHIFMTSAKFLYVRIQQCVKTNSNTLVLYLVCCFFPPCKTKLPLTLVAEGAEEAGETFTVAADMVARSIAVDTLRTRLAASVAVETGRAGCRNTHAHS